jgi:23S rRNA (pseudouridine1915-N3)-methyltransferase
MRLQIVAVGKLKAGPEQELFGRFSDRINKSGKPVHLIGPEVFEISEAKSSSVDARKSAEADLLLQKIDPTACVIVLDEHGKDMTSTDFSEFLVNERNGGTPSIVFAIGGPDGHGDAMLKRANRKIRFGSMTWPHQMVRVMLAEQIYRAITILSGHPYHRE